MSSKPSLCSARYLQSFRKARDLETDDSAEIRNFSDNFDYLVMCLISCTIANI